jgi:hypothetical protein
MKARLLRLCAACFLAPLLMASSCDEEPDEPPPDCDQRVGTDAEGTWTLRARGRRSGCSNKDLNGKLEIDVRSFFVDGTPVPTDDNTSGDAVFEADAFVERIRRAQYTLSAGTDAPAGLEFNGVLNTCQVKFTMRESLPGGTFHEYQFDGFVESTYRIYGEFEGRGPGSCVSEGSFEVDLF